MKRLCIALSGLILCCLSVVWAHPIPDIPVYSTFDAKSVSIEVLIDPRSFTDDPEGEPYMHNSELGFKDEDKLQALKDEGQELMNRTIAFQFSPGGKVMPEFEFDFTGMDKTKLEQDTDPVFLIGVAKVDIPEGAKQYQITADESGELSVIFRNKIKGKDVERYMVLFPGESSFELDITDR